MIKKIFVWSIFCLLGLDLVSQNELLPQTGKKCYFQGQFSMGYGYYLEGSDLISPGFEFRGGKFLTRNLAWGGGVAYTHFKPIEGLYGVSILSELKYFLRDDHKNWRFFGITDIGLGVGGSRLQTGWAMQNAGPRFYIGSGISRKWKGDAKITMEAGYLFQNLAFIDNTSGRGWQIFQSESIMKYNFRRLQIKTGILF